ncbi:Lrp/AsnC family transcriptional regulator [Candidatus Woesearchaeota archaeon]|nr:Lrp/AsnC family transcriptional regulator [Candidatus Woesearchaeota archaeon]
MQVLAQKSPELKLDAKDWHILKELVQNIRQPLSQIARKTQLSRQTVEYRLRQMQQHNLITGSRAVINIRSLGYKSFHVFAELHTVQQEQELIRRALESPWVNALIIYSGKYNVEVSIMARSEEEFLLAYQKLMEELSIRSDLTLTLLSTLRNEVLPAPYFPHHKPEERLHPVPASVQLPLDKTDRSLLLALAEDATLSNLKVAQRLHLSKDTVAYRLQKLVKAGCLVQYRPALNYDVLGLSINSVLLKVNPLPSQIAKLEQFLRTNNRILWAAKTFGAYDYIVYIITNDLPEFHEVISLVKEKFQNVIRTYEVLFAYKEYKYSFMAKVVGQKG